MGKRSTTKPIQVPPTETLLVPSKTSSRLIPLALTAILGACAVIVAVVIVTPMPDEDSAPDGETTRIAQDAQTDAQPIVELPRVAKEINVEQL